MYLSILNSQTANSKQLNSQQTTNSCSCMYVCMYTSLLYCPQFFFLKGFTFYLFQRTIQLNVKSQASWMMRWMWWNVNYQNSTFRQTMWWNDASLDSTFRQTLFHIVPRCTNALHIRRVHWLPQDTSTVARGGRDQYVWDGDIDAQDPTIMGFDNVLSIKIISKNVVHDNFFIVSYTE